MAKTLNNLTREVLTYKQALAVKELGFNKPCFGLYINGEFHPFVALHQRGDKVILAPLKSQVFRFFREKYNQNSFIELVYQDGIKYDYVLYADKDEEECENFGDGPFGTYEKAENACIDKLIELAKQKEI